MNSVSQCHEGRRAPQMMELEVPVRVRQELRRLYDIAGQAHELELHGLGLAASDALEVYLHAVLVMMELPPAQWRYDFERECLVHTSFAEYETEGPR